MIPGGTEFCHWLRRTCGFRMERNGMKNLSNSFDGVYRKLEVSRFQGTSRRSLLRRDDNISTRDDSGTVIQNGAQRSEETNEVVRRSQTQRSGSTKSISF